MNGIDRLIDSNDISCLLGNRERASKILAAVEGMSVLEARDLLKGCHDVLELLEVRFDTM